MKSTAQGLTKENVIFQENDFRVVAYDKPASISEKAYHECLEIKYFYEGKSTIMIDSEMISVESGDIVIVNPYEIHANVVNENDRSKYYLLEIDLDFFSNTGITDMDLRQLLLVKRYRFNHCISNKKRLQKLIVRVKQELDEKKEYYRQVVANLLGEFFALLLREEIDHGKRDVWDKDNSRKMDVISPALSKIFSDFSGRLSVDELAGLCNISKYHFCRVFKEQMGTSVTQYIINYRISVAESMLKDDTLSIRKIASQCGFEDLSYFYRCYKRITGMSPNKSRN